MATIKLGAIVTEIAGSVGGTTFRRFKNGTVMQNKQFGASKNKLLKNKALPILTGIISAWSTLSLAVQNEWKDQALLFQFSDKFGNLKNLTGRQLYIKLQSQNTFSGGGLVDVFNLINTTTPIVITDITLDSTPNCELNLTNPVLNGTLNIQAQQINNSSVGFSFTRREIIFSETVVSETNFDFTTEFYNYFPNPQEGMVFNIYIFSSNEYGFRSQTVGIQATIVG